MTAKINLTSALETMNVLHRANNKKNLKQHLCNSLLQLVKHTSPQKCKWIGSNTDLMELVYEVYQLGVVFTTQGNPFSLKALTHLFYTFFNLKTPRNPSALAQRAKNRKGIKKISFIERYELLFGAFPNVLPAIKEIIYI